MSEDHNKTIMSSKNDIRIVSDLVDPLAATMKITRDFLPQSRRDINEQKILREQFARVAIFDYGKGDADPASKLSRETVISGLSQYLKKNKDTVAAIENINTVIRPMMVLLVENGGEKITDEKSIEILIVEARRQVAAISGVDMGLVDEVTRETVSKTSYWNLRNWFRRK